MGGVWLVGGKKGAVNMELMGVVSRGQWSKWSAGGEGG